MKIAKMERDKIFLEVTRIALFDPIELYNYDGTLRTVDELPDAVRVAVLPNDKEHQGPAERRSDAPTEI
ncbi:MAG: hypothetical protein H0X25_04310 [Acidobacteriales bacterium]|nr:hypothetical protein [Terriglobales bacterium]